MDIITSFLGRSWEWKSQIKTFIYLAYSVKCQQNQTDQKNCNQLAHQPLFSVKDKIYLLIYGIASNSSSEKMSCIHSHNVKTLNYFLFLCVITFYPECWDIFWVFAVLHLLGVGGFSDCDTNVLKWFLCYGALASAWDITLKDDYSSYGKRVIIWPFSSYGSELKWHKRDIGPN